MKPIIPLKNSPQYNEVVLINPLYHFIAPNKSPTPTVADNKS
jgi:hypothetical protein